MRGMSFLLDRTVKLREQRIPDSRLERTAESRWRRLDDDIAETFYLACTEGDLAAAGDLLAILEKWHIQRRYTDLREQQTRTTRLKRLGGELERQHITRGIRRPDAR